MHKFILASLLIFSFNVNAAIVSNSTTDQNGLSFTTTIDTDLREIYYDLELSSLPSNFDQIVFKSPLFQIGAIWPNGSVTASGMTEANIHDFNIDGKDPSVELQFFHSVSPQLFRVTMTYVSDYSFTGNWLGTSDDINLVITLVSKDEVELWIYQPELTNVPIPAAVWLFMSGIIGLVSIGRRKSWK